MSKKFYKKGLAWGFTLIELLIVISIITILSSIVLASLNSARARGRDTKRISDIKQIQLSLQLYADANSDKYPPGAQNNSTVAPNIVLQNLLVPTFIPVLPMDPSNNKPYDYQALNNSSGGVCSVEPCYFYHLGTSLEQDNATAKNNDVDACAPPAAGCSLSGTTINGNDTTGKCISTDPGTNFCFDVTP